MSISFLQKLKPVYEEDDVNWQKIVKELNNEIPPIFWYGGAGWDYIHVKKLFRGDFPIEAKKLLSPNIIPVLTDYYWKILEDFKINYGCFLSRRRKSSDGYSFGEYSEPFSFFGSFPFFPLLQMIPLTLFSPEDLYRIRKEYNGFHPYMTPSVIPDDRWHFTYLQVKFNNKACSIIYGHIENLVFWKEVVEKYDLKVDAFCALRMGGKSGCWDTPYNPKESKLFEAIRTSKAQKPKLWIVDLKREISKIWREILPPEGDSYGDMSFFEANWDIL